MAVGGRGDVLFGICGAFLCQGMPAEQAARLAVYAHACAADRVAMQQGEIGLLASDVSQQLPKVINAEYE
jgi:NAD(P)H-hydrate epimerase